MKFKKIKPDKLRAKSLLRASDEAIQTAKTIILKESTLKSIFRELYEGLRQYCEAIGYLRGYKFLSHEVITSFLLRELNENSIAKRFDRYRELRNRINYYGHDISTETIREALNDIPLIIKQLSKYLVKPKNN